MAQNQDRAFLIAGWKSCFDPCTHGILMGAEQPGDFLYRVAAADVDPAVIGVTFAH